MVDDPPSSFYEPLSRLLLSFSSMHPQIFYKPVFLCATATKEEAAARQLGILVAISEYMPNFWTSDPEMVSVALMNDASGGAGLGKGKRKEGQPPEWGKARLGQTVLLLELIGKLKGIREELNKKQESGVVYAILSL